MANMLDGKELTKSPPIEEVDTFSAPDLFKHISTRMKELFPKSSKDSRLEYMHEEFQETLDAASNFRYKGPVNQQSLGALIEQQQAVLLDNISDTEVRSAEAADHFIKVVNEANVELKGHMRDLVNIVNVEKEIGDLIITAIDFGVRMGCDEMSIARHIVDKMKGLGERDYVFVPDFDEDEEEFKETGKYMQRRKLTEEDRDKMMAQEEGYNSVEEWIDAGPDEPVEVEEEDEDDETSQDLGDETDE